MKTINDYILEKFKINSKTAKKKDNNIDINVEQSVFKSFDSEKIIDFVNNLPILPYEIKSTSSGNIIVCHYNKKADKCFILFDAESSKSFQVAFRSSLKENTIFYPAADKYYKSLEECFECINANWDNWEKYLE